MNRITLILSMLPFFLSVCKWSADGFRVGFWLSSVQTNKEVPLLEGMPEWGTQTQVIWEDQFVSGIETPVLGLVVSASALLLVLMMERRKKKS